MILLYILHHWANGTLFSRPRRYRPATAAAHHGGLLTGQSPFLVGKSSVDGSFAIAILHY